MLLQRLGWILSVVSLTVGCASTSSRNAIPERRCVALGFGPWIGDTAEGHYSVVKVRTPSILQLSNAPPEWFPKMRSSFDARVVNASGLRANVWSASGDSIEIVATAALSDGWILRGVWRGDTLEGRVVGTSDALAPNTPRASAYGQIVRCDDSTAVAAGALNVQRWMEVAVRDSVANAREQKAEAAWWDEVRRTGTLPRTSPPAAP